MEPKDFFRVILRRRRTVITAVVVVVGVTLFGSLRKDPTYLASCKVRIAAVAPGGGGQINEDPKKNPTEIYASFEEMSEILMSPIMAKEVAARLSVPYERVAGRINAGNQANTGIFNLGVVDADAVFAAKMCDTYMVQFLEDRVRLATERVSQSKTVLESRRGAHQRRLTRVNQQIVAATNQLDADGLRLTKLQIIAEIEDIDSNIADLENALEVQLGGGGQVVTPAGLAGTKVGPDHKRDAILGLIVGLIFGAGLALLREFMDDTVRDKEAAIRDLGLPVLASMPAGRGDDPFGDDGGGSIEAARMLRTNLSSQGLGADVRCVVVTSTLAKRTPTTLVGLAGAIAEAGRTVLVIGADFRQSRVHEAFGVGNAVGLTNVVRGQVTFDKAIRPVPGQVGVYVMPSGPVIGNPGELLSTEEMAMVIRRARKWADVVLIDAPPVLAAADASVLGTYADGVLLVMSAGQTLRSQANEAKEQLKAAGARLLGAVMFGASDRGDGKVLNLPVLRRGDDDGGRPPLAPYGGFEASGNYGGGYGDYQSFDNAYGNYQFQSIDNGYDGFDDGLGYDDEPIARPRARSAAKKPAAKPKKKSGGPKRKSVAATSPARITREDKAIKPASRRPSASRFERAPAASKRTAATPNGSGRSSQYGNGNGTRRPGPAKGRATGSKPKANGKAQSPARKPERTSRYDRDLF